MLVCASISHAGILTQVRLHTYCALDCLYSPSIRYLKQVFVSSYILNITEERLRRSAGPKRQGFRALSNKAAKNSTILV